MTELSLGDIRGHALRGNALEGERELAEARVRADAQLLSAFELSRLIGKRLNVTPEEAFDRLSTIPDNLLSLLHSPQGWTALGEYVAVGLDLPGPALCPTLH